LGVKGFALRFNRKNREIRKILPQRPTPAAYCGGKVKESIGITYLKLQLISTIAKKAVENKYGLHRISSIKKTHI